MVIAYLITFLSGVSFFIGYLVTVLLNNNKKLVTFSLGFSFIIIFGLIIFDLLPECLELVDNKAIILLYALIALFIHNIIESTAIYTASLTNTSLGLMMAIGVSFHNIPLGIQISSMIKNKKEKLLLITGLTFSSLVGIIVLNLLKITLSDGVLCVLISITLGMLIYISLFELLCEVKENIKKKELQLGIFSGIVLVIISELI